MAPQTGNPRPWLVVGNWKMNGSLAANKILLDGLVAGWQGLTGVEAAICPPFPYIHQVAHALDNSSGLKWGAQTLGAEAGGAFTGQVAGDMLADFGCRYVIVGHNERRRLQGESDEVVAGQFAAAQAAGILPILCVGESEDAREAGETLDVINRQLSEVIDRVGIDAFARAVVAYEPIWAVGTGKTATPEQAQEVHAFIRSRLGAVGDLLPLLYGGSVKPQNAASLFAMADIDGALLGGASLKADEFLAICRCASEA